MLPVQSSGATCAPASAGNVNSAMVNDPKLNADDRAAYLSTLALGLKESRDWDDDEVAAYFERVGVVID